MNMLAIIRACVALVQFGTVPAGDGNGAGRRQAAKTGLDVCRHNLIVLSRIRQLLLIKVTLHSSSLHVHSAQE